MFYCLPKLTLVQFAKQNVFMLYHTYKLIHTHLMVDLFQKNLTNVLWKV